MATTRQLFFKAIPIALKFRYPLPLPWEGKRWVWHFYHAGYIAWKVTYRRFLTRFLYIYDEKPRKQHAHRYRVMRVVRGSLPESRNHPDSQHLSSCVEGSWHDDDLLKVEALEKKEVPSSGWNRDFDSIPELDTGD